MALANQNKSNQEPASQNRGEPFDPWEEAEKKASFGNTPEVSKKPVGEQPPAALEEETPPAFESLPKTPPSKKMPSEGEIPLEGSRAGGEELFESHFPPLKETPSAKPEEPKAELKEKTAPGLEHDYFGVSQEKTPSAPSVPWGKEAPPQEPLKTSGLAPEPREGKPLKVKGKKKPALWKEILKFVGIFVAVFAIIFVVLNWPSISVNLKYWWEQNRGGQDSTAEEIDVGVETPEEIPKDDRIVIGKIKVNAPIIFSKNHDEKTLLEDLKRGVVHYPGTAMPGETGNCFITGHSSNYWWIKSKYNTVFTLLPKLVVGDKLIIYYKQKKYIYEIKDKFEVGPSQTEVLNPSENPILTLMTCVPIGTNLRRLILKADQVSPAPGENVDLNRPRLPAE